jgi:hypothetical protein|tara:strand:- start:8039 stop:8971 length:933 start_codon:yes stop_codon:yes gene_type:complete
MAEAQQTVAEKTDKQVPLDFDADAPDVEVSLESPALAEEVSDAEVIEVREVEEKTEQEEYTTTVQKRIDRLTKKMREAERQREEALKYAQNVQIESNDLKARMQQLDQGYVSEYGSRITAEQEQAEGELRKAVELGDVDATVAAQKTMTQLAVAQDRYEQAKAQQEQQVAQEAAYAQQLAQQNQANYAQQPAAAPPTDPKAEKWAARNEWFGQDEAMTFAAFGIHKKMVESEGFDPQSDDYYSELDERIQTEFPQKFNGTSKRAAQTVAGVSRSSSSGRGKTKVRLTPSQVSIAKKLGVPLEEYAKYVKE